MKQNIGANNSTTLYDTQARYLQSSVAGPTPIDNSIICIPPGDVVSFQINKEHFPIYVKDSIYNSDPNYDDGIFEVLKIKLLNADLDIDSFMNTFTEPGVFVFGDYSDPIDLQTIVRVSDTVCGDQSRYAFTLENMQLLGIAKQQRELKVFEDALIAIPICFTAILFFTIYIQHVWEQRIYRQELEAKLKRVGHLKHFYKKKEDRFDHREYLEDLYNIIQANLDEIQELLAKHAEGQNLRALMEN